MPICHAGETIECEQCYRCTEYDVYGSCIGECVYDVYACTGECADGSIYDPETGQCIPSAEEICNSGAYMDVDGTCVECPYVNIVSGNYCIESDGVSMDSCHLVAADNCGFSDNTGNFVVTDECPWRIQ